MNILLRYFFNNPRELCSFIFLKQEHVLRIVVTVLELKPPTLTMSCVHICDANLWKATEHTGILYGWSKTGKGKFQRLMLSIFVFESKIKFPEDL